MSNQPGLSDHKRYEAFTGKWRSSHVVKELEIPDEEEDGCSVLLSFLNTVLLCSPQAHSASAFMRRELF